MRAAPMSRQHVRPRKAVFPAAGFGARFLPATKACPKEMLPIVDRPLIQYAVEEAADAGIREIIFVTGRSKRAIEDHFDKAYELERELTAQDDMEGLRALDSVLPRGVTFSYVRQPALSGAGAALLRARALTGDEAFAVLLADDLIDGERPPIGELLDMFEQEGSSIAGVTALDPGEAAGEDSVAVDEARGTIRPGGNGIASRFTLAGRCVFTPAIWPALAGAQSGRERLSLADAVGLLLTRETVRACEIGGHRYDCRTKLGYLQAQLAYARKRPELWRQLRESIEAMIEPPIGHRSPRYVARSGSLTSS
jgi:UTP--glucose-1-phosphate uridylyltransferase